MDEKQNQPFQLSFNTSLKIDFQGSRVTSDGGLILVRELDERLGLGDLIAQHLTDSRRGKNTQLPLADLLRQSVYSRIAGYEDVNDAERLSQDPTFRLIGAEKIWERGAAPTSRLQSFETELLTPRRKPRWPAFDQPRADRPRRKPSSRRSGWYWTWTAPRSRSMASRRTAPATATLSPLAITRYCCSTAAPADRIGRQGGKQTGRRKEGDGEVFEKSLGMGHFRVFVSGRRQSWPLSWTVGVAGDRKDK